jgi:hypothetical protein
MRVSVDGGHADTPLEKGRGVPSSTKRSVQNVPCVAKQLSDLSGEDRFVVRALSVHNTPAVCSRPF